MSQDEVIAAISDDKKKKKSENIKKTTKTCKSCGYDWPHINQKCLAIGQSCNNCKRMNHFGQVCPNQLSQTSSITNPHNKMSSILFSSIEHVMGIANKSELPKLQVLISCQNNAPPESMEVVADTGAQVNVAGPSHMKRFRIKRNQLKGVPTSLKHAGGSHLQVLGSHSMYVIHNDKLVETEIYFASGVQNIYLSLDLCKSLSLIHEQFPRVNIDHVQANSISDSNTSHTIPT